MSWKMREIFCAVTAPERAGLFFDAVRALRRATVNRHIHDVNIVALWCAEPGAAASALGRAARRNNKELRPFFLFFSLFLRERALQEATACPFFSWCQIASARIVSRDNSVTEVPPASIKRSDVAWRSFSSRNLPGIRKLVGRSRERKCAPSAVGARVAPTSTSAGLSGHS